MSKEYQDWLERIRVARNKHEREVQDTTRLFYDFYRGKQWTEEDSVLFNDTIVDNMVFSTISAIKPTINIQRPKVFVSPTKSQFIVEGRTIDGTRGAARVEVLADFLYERLRMEDALDQALVDALVGHWGLIMVGYEIKTNRTQSHPELDEFLEIIESESLFVQRLSPMDFIRDPMGTGHDLIDDRWIGIKWIRPLDEVKDDPAFKNTSNLQANTTLAIEEKVDGGPRIPKGGVVNGDDSVWNMVTGWSIWDRKNQKVWEIVEDHDKALAVEDWPIQYSGFPVEPLWFNFNPDEQIPIAETSLYKTRQEMLNKLESKVLDHVSRTSDTKYGVNINKLKNPQSLDSWAKGKSGSVLLVQGSPRDAIMETQPGKVSSDLYNTVLLLKKDIAAQIGVAQFELGAAQNLETAKEGSLLSGGIASRRSDRVNIVQRFMSRVLAKVIKTAQQVLPEDAQEIPITRDQVDQLRQADPSSLVQRRVERGDQRGTQVSEIFPFMRVDRLLIGGEYSYSIDIGSKGPESELQDRQDATALVQFAANNPLLDKSEVTKVALEKFGFATYIDRLMRDPAKVQQEEQKKLQQAIKSEIAKDAPKRQVDLRKTQLKTKTDLLKELIRAEIEREKIESGEKEGDKDRGADMVESLMDSIKETVKERKKNAKSV